MQTNNFFFSQISPTIPGLSPSENIGFNTFINKGRCNSCHNITGGGGSVNMGHTYGGSGGDLPPTNMPTVGTNTGLDVVYSDHGVMNLTGKPIDDGRFLIPGLRNVELTAPYMHDGRFATLEDVIDFYGHGVKDHPNLAVQLRDFSSENNSVLVGLLNQMNMDFDNGGFMDDAMLMEEFGVFIPAGAPVVAKKLNLTPAEKKGLVDFLKTFTDKTFTNDTRLRDPFVLE
ncbi:MAG: hypothetical protein M0D57_13400 [Sphingobacteriales bacterium JAD_PAG50586_3]|nr:MAG: hypothetical protein M0D57_13400 [Sphingobacteriales bacterium JAD_PAG50586_3]